MPSPKQPLILSAKALDQLELAPPIALVDDPVRVLRAARVVLHGAPGAAKTWCAVMIAVAVAANGGTALLLLGEGGLHSIRDRLRKLARGLGTTLARLGDRLRVVSGGFDIVGSDDRARAVEQAVAEKVPDVVVVDPLIAFFTGDENAAGDVGAFLHVLDTLAELGSAVVLVHHNNRADRDMRGSSAVRAWADAVFGFEANDGELIRTMVSNTKARDEARQPPRVLTFTMESDRVVCSAEQGVAAPQGHARIDERVRAALASGSRTAAELKAQLRLSGAALKSALARLSAANAISSVAVARKDTRGRARRETAFRLVDAKARGDVGT